ncbi:MAG TPA: glucose-6-phosphate dehydrogenase [Bacteroidales bacterium]|nr:glucose-6-phosphate dehydrogenase [Bacteroidales bacterium]
MKINENQLLIIFGASGDLTERKLIPALYDLHIQKLLPDGFAVLGVSRTKYSDSDFRKKMKEGIKSFSNKDTSDEEPIEKFAEKLHYIPINTKDQADYAKLADRLEALDQQFQTGGNHIFYLATPPSLYRIIPANLAAHGLSNQSNGEEGWKRIIIEKPFGTDLESARDLNKELLHCFKEEQIYRIDHYLGKETVQNLLVTRFSNGILEPLWNRNYVNHVEITAAESIGVENRGGYYDSSGALRDMVQNHLLQLLGLVAMEPPTMIEASSIRNEMLKVFQSLRPVTPQTVGQLVIRGQYTESMVRGEKVKSYREEKDVSPDSKTETFVAMKCFVDNWRWAGVPFYIRTGKRLPTRVTEIVIHFKSTPHHLFVINPQIYKNYNQLVIRIQPDEGVLLKMGMKVPGAGFHVQDINLDFHYNELSDQYLPSAYERLLLDCMLGDPTLYTRGDALEAAWKFIDPVMDAWKNNPDLKIYGYPAGSWGPDVADSMIEEPHLTWRYPCKNLADDGIYCEL